ncbi:hypothetical protein HK405_002081, partial [Cladochytrium tenue]
ISARRRWPGPTRRRWSGRGRRSGTCLRLQRRARGGCPRLVCRGTCNGRCGRPRSFA